VKPTKTSPTSYRLEIRFSGHALYAEAGEIVQLRGAVGSGKSLWLKRMAGLAGLPAGLTVTINGASVSAPRSEHAVRMYFDRWPPVWLGQCVAEELAFGLQRSPSATAMKDVLRHWKIGDLGLDAEMKDINRLQAVRLSLAGMVLASPALALLDNPVASLPEAEARAVCADIAEWAEQGESIIVVAANRWQDWHPAVGQVWRIDPAGALLQQEPSPD